MSDIMAGSVAVEVVPDARRFAPDLKAKLKGLTVNVGVTADTTKLRTELDEATRGRTSTVNVNADTAAAAAQIDEVARDRTANIRVNSSGLGSATSGLSGMMAAILGLGPALIPVTAAVAGFGAALAAPLAAAGGGLTVGAIIAGAAVKRTEKQLKQIDALKKKMDAAKASAQAAGIAAGASSANSLASARNSAHNSIASAQAALAAATTPAGRAAAEQRIAAARASLSMREATIAASASTAQAAAQAKVTAATQAYQAALAGLTPAQKKFRDAQNHLKSSFDHLIQTSGTAILGPVVKGMNLLSKVLPKLAPLLSGAAKGVGTLLKDVARFTSGPDFKAFMKGFGSASASAIVSFGRIAENFGKGLFGIFQAFAPLSAAFVGGLTKMSETFANFGANAGSNKGFQAFLAYVKDIGPKVAQTFGDIVAVVVKIAIALAPLGGIVLDFVDGIAKFIRHAKPSTLEAIGVAIGGIALAMGKGPLGLAFALGATLAHSDKFVSFLKKAGGYARDFGKWFDKLPDGIKAASLALVGVGALAVKFKGGIGSLLFGGKNSLGGKSGGLFGLISKAKPVPVIVMNDWGKPGSGGLPTVLKDAEKGAPVAAAGAGVTAAGATAIALITGGLFNQFGGRAPTSGSPLSGLHDVKMPSITGWAAKTFLKITGQSDDATASVKNLQKQIAGLPANVHVQFNEPGLSEAQKRILEYGSYLDGLDGRVVRTFVKSIMTKNDIGEGAGGQPPNRSHREHGGPVLRGQAYIVGERRPELFIPSENGRIDPNPRMAGGHNGPMFHVDKVEAQDVNHFLRQMQSRAVAQAGGGVNF